MRLAYGILLMNLNHLRNARVLVVGDVILDRYWFGEATRISPEAPAPIVHVENMESRLGGAANVAMNVCSLGAKVYLIGMVGSDENAGRLTDLLDAAAIETSMACKQGFKTPTKLRVISRNQQLLRLDHENDQSKPDNTEVIELCKKHMPDYETLVISDYDKGAVTQVQEIISTAREENKKVIVDPKGTSFDKYRNANIITPNFQEFSLVAGPCEEETELEDKANRMCQKLNLDALLVTRSERGMSLYVQGQQARHFPTRAKEVYDVTGAGDTVVGLFASAVSANFSLPDSVKIANLGAGIAVSRLGTVSVTLEELNLSLNEPFAKGKRVTDLDELRQSLSALRKSGEKIVFTNGCFDLIHQGHIACLRDAKSRGDCLIVAINDDASVRNLKGEGRPVCSLKNRMAVLEELSCIDWIIPFSEETPLALIQELKPDVYIKGGDYEKEKLVEAGLVRSYGGEVVLSPYVEGCSTTGIIDSILKS